MSAPIIWTSTGSKLLQSTFRDKDDVAFAKITDVSQGEINLNPNPSSVIDTSGVTATGTATVTRVATGGPLDPAIPTAFRLDAGAVDDYVEFPFTVPDALANTKLKVEWFQEPESGAASGEWRVEVHDGSGEYTLSTDSSGDTEIPALTGKFTTTFDTGAAGTDYKVRFVRVSGANHLDVTSVIVGPGIQPQGVAGGIYSDTIQFQNSTGLSPTSGLSMRRFGDLLFLDGFISFSGDGTDTGTFGIKLQNVTFTAPNSENIKVTLRKKGATDTSIDAVAFLSGNYLAFRPNDGTSAFSPLNGNQFGGVSNGRYSQIYLANVAIPIAEWAGSGTVNLAQNDVEYASVGGTWDAASSTTVYGPSGSAMGGTLTASRDKTITWSTPVQASDRIQIWGSKDQVNWFPINGCQLGSISMPAAISYNASGDPISGVGYRAGASANQTIITFYQYMALANDDAGQRDWPSSAAYWVATKSAAGQAVGFGEMQPSVASGLVSAHGLKGFTDGSSAPSGYVGQEISAGSWSTTSYTATAGTAVTVATISDLPVGEWELTVHATLDVIGGSASTINTLAELNVSDGSAVVARGLAGGPVTSSNGMQFPITLVQKLTNTAVQDYTLQVVCNQAAANAKVRVYGTNTNISSTLRAPGTFVIRRVR